MVEIARVWMGEGEKEEFVSGERHREHGWE